jgi:hypothetical protein
MTPTGAVILFVCFAGPILPPVIGFVVGTLFDLFRRKREPSDVRARRRLASTAATPR